MGSGKASARGADGRLFALMLGVFLGGGLLNSVEALLVPRLRLEWSLDYAQALLVQLAYYASYLVFAVPATLLAERAGAMRAIAAGLAVMAAGCLAFVLAFAAHLFPAMLAALLAVSAGVTVLQIACNGVMATHGDRDRAAARFTLLQGFNSLGTVLGPLAAAWFLLGGGGGVSPLLPFIAFAAGFALLALAFAGHRDLLGRSVAAPRHGRVWRLLGERRVLAGAAAIFAYVGAEVTLGTLCVNYLMLPDRGALAPVAAGQRASLYWLGAMVGRFAGAWVLRTFSPVALLAAASLLAMALTGLAIFPTGSLGAAALLGVGLANSIMFPTIFGLAMPTRAEDVPAASMLMCMAVVGGALVPVLTGLVADRLTLSASLVVPLLCYGAILLFARRSAATGARPA
jgi:MFS transporter, FHS family, L-fucose permease